MYILKIKNIKDIPKVPANHQGEVLKKVLLNKGEVPHLMMFSSATFKPNQKVEAHKHDTMYEIYFIQSGKALFVINNEEIQVKPGEIHYQSNPFAEEVTWLYFGIATDE